jgi:diguanylate cyclase (GGDEF)-like protein
MISIKKYLDTTEREVLTAPLPSADLLAIALQCYRGVLQALGKSAVQISPGLGADLDADLKGLASGLAQQLTVPGLDHTGNQIDTRVQEWGTRTAELFRAQADVVKELMTALASTAESVGSRDGGYANQFRDLTRRLESIADFDDLTRIRLCLATCVTELKAGVDQMARESQRMVSQLRGELSAYEDRLKAVEHLALRDELTGLANRRSVEERIQRQIEGQRSFCVVILDLNHFKQVNDTHGHLVGDDLLRQFAIELQSNVRSNDLVGRLGGDEFIIVFSCGLQIAQGHIQRIREWVFGKYTVRGVGQNPLTIPMDASIGSAEWRVGKTMQQLLSEADASMYKDKKRARPRQG